MTIQEDVNPDLLASLRQPAENMVTTQVPKDASNVQDAIPKIAPKWLKYDR